MRDLATVDVAYERHRGAAAAVTFADWTDAEAKADRVVATGAPEPYVPGAFHRRELPPILAVLAALPQRPRVVVIDGYVWLDTEGRRPGLGARLFEALGEDTIVVGVAKTCYAGAGGIEVHRGGSTRPLHISCAGENPATAADWIRSMHGEHRMPTLLKRVDRLCRDALLDPSVS